MPFFRGLSGQRANHVVGLEAVELQNRQPHGFAHSPHVGQLDGEISGIGGPLRLVFIE